MLAQPTQMATKKSNVAPITIYKNGNKYDAKRFIFNPKYVRTFDAFLDQITMETNATCAVRKIYTPHGSRQVGKLSSIEPGGRYVAVTRGAFQKIPYGEKIDMGLSSAGTTATKTSKRQKVTSRLQRSYEDQIKTQKTIYVHRNGFNEPATQIFFTKRLLRSLSQVLDFVQEKITCERAVVSLHKLNGVTIDDVKKLQPEGRYVAVEQGQRFRHRSYDQMDTGATSPRRIKFPEIKPQRVHPNGRRTRQRYPSNESSQELTSRSKPKIKLPLIKQNINDAQGFHVVHGYPDKHAMQITQTYHTGENKHTNTNAGPFHASGAQQEFAMAIRDDKRVRVERPLDMMQATEVEEQLDGVDYHGNEKRGQLERRVKPTTTKRKSKDIAQPTNKENVTLPQINKVPNPPSKRNISFPTKPSIAHPRRHTHAQNKRKEHVIPKSTVNDQRFVSQDNSMATTKRYIVTREQHVFGMHGRDGREHAKGVIHQYETGARIKGLERENQELEKRKRVEDWVDYTVEVKRKEDEIASVAKQLVTTAIANAVRTLDIDESNTVPNKQSKPKLYEDSKSEVKYRRVFGL